MGNLNCICFIFISIRLYIMYIDKIRKVDIKIKNYDFFVLYIICGIYLFLYIFEWDEEVYIYLKN